MQIKGLCGLHISVTKRFAIKYNLIIIHFLETENKQFPFVTFQRLEKHIVYY